jgi:hypothetical protein
MCLQLEEIQNDCRTTTQCNLEILNPTMFSFTKLDISHSIQEEQ